MSGEKKAHQTDSKGYVAYVTYDAHLNTEFMVEPGTPVKLPPSPYTPPGVVSISHREGDVVARFVGGILTTNDPQVIDWCDNHPTICRPAADPRTKGWLALKNTQVATSTREAQNHDLDADELMFGSGAPDGRGDRVMAPGADSGRAAAAVAAGIKAQDDASVPHDPAYRP